MSFGSVDRSSNDWEWRIVSYHVIYFTLHYNVTPNFETAPVGSFLVTDVRMTVGDDPPKGREGVCTVTGSFETGVICFDPMDGTLSRLLPGYVNKHTYTAVASNNTNNSSFTERRIVL